MNIWNNNALWEKDKAIIINLTLLAGFIFSLGGAILLELAWEDDFSDILLTTLGVVITALGVFAFVLFIHFALQHDKWLKRKHEEAEEKEKIAKEEEERRRIEEEKRRKEEETRCPKCGQLNAIRIERKLVNERLVGVREARYFNSVYEVEDYEQEYLVFEECRFCGYSTSHSTIERRTEKVRLIY